MTAPPSAVQQFSSSWPPPFGANFVPGGVRFAVWAPNADRVDVHIVDASGAPTGRYRLAPLGDGRFAVTVTGTGAGARYRFVLDGGPGLPDPYSRFQPEGPHGPSEVVDPDAYVWQGDDWPGLTAEGLAIYECHVGTMTPQGTFAALIDQLPELRRLGVTAIELLPVAECPGRWNWGYDGVDLFAPSHNYGRPGDLKRLVDAAHREGLGVLLDVVYNHLGPDGNYLRAYADDYFTDRHTTPWGDAINCDGPNSRFARDYVIHNACYWLSEYRFDGLRLDATDQIKDDGPVHILQELAERAREAVAPRSVVISAEDAHNDVRIIRRTEQGGFGLDGDWADDFHHQVRVLLTGVRGNYLDEYEGSTGDIARTINSGFFYQGQPARTSGKSLGTKVTDEPASAFVFTIQNHDQVGNRAYGERLHHEIAPDRYKTASALLLVLPYTPLLFMGQEFAASASFMFFTDHNDELGRLVTEGRREEFKGFPAFADPVLRASIPDPQDPETFLRSKLDLSEREVNAPIYELYRELLRLRREDPVLRVQDRATTHADAIGAQIVTVHRWHQDEHRLLVANFGPSVGITPANHPALAHLPAAGWELLLTTDDRRFGGAGHRCGLFELGDGQRIEVPARTAAIFAFTG
jgi:maltooligosyltrehalose trehalohydrolase